MRPFPTLLLLASCATAPPRRPPVPERSTPPDLTVMTYNVNFGLAGDEATLDAIRDGGTDVVLLQETTEEWQASIDARLADEYPTRLFRHCCRAGGLAVLSRYPVRDMEVLPPREGWFPAWRVVVRTPSGPVQILNVHLRPAVSDSGSVISGAYTTPRIRRAEIEGFYREVDRSLPTLVAGDLNEGESGHAVAYLEAQGLTSVFADRGPYRPSGPYRTTWRWRTSVGTLRLQLDHVFCNGMLRPLWARVLRTGRSDHYPIVAGFVRAR